MAYGYWFPSLCDKTRCTGTDYQILIRQYWGFGLLLSLTCPWTNAYQARRAYSTVLQKSNTDNLFVVTLGYLFENFNQANFTALIKSENQNNATSSQESQEQTKETWLDRNILTKAFLHFPLVYVIKKLFSSAVPWKDKIKALNPLTLVIEAIACIQCLYQQIVVKTLEFATNKLFAILKDSTQYKIIKVLAAIALLFTALASGLSKEFGHRAFNCVKIGLSFPERLIGIVLAGITEIADFIIDKFKNLGKTLVVSKDGIDTERFNQSYDLIVAATNSGDNKNWSSSTSHQAVHRNSCTVNNAAVLFNIVRTSNGQQSEKENDGLPQPRAASSFVSLSRQLVISQGGK